MLFQMLFQKCYDNKSDKFKFRSKDLTKRVQDESEDGIISKYRRVIDEANNITSTNRELRTVNHMVATNEQTKDLVFLPKKTRLR